MIKNRSKITIKGLNQERTINNLIKSVKIYNFKREEADISHFEVEYKDREFVKQFLEKEKIEVLAFSHFGLWNFLLNLLKSYGIMIALAICMVIYALQYNFILKIEVLGGEKGLNSQITQFIDNSLTTRLRGQIDLKELENLVRGEFDEVSSVSIAIIGQSLVVSVNEVDVPEEIEGEFSSIVSQYDGRIVNIKLIQGTLAVNEGDIVKEGDILVYPYIYDSQGVQIATQPKAEIYADVWLTGEETHYDCYMKSERTGRRVEVNEVYLNSLLIYGSQTENAFVEYEIESYWLELTKNLILPLKLKKTFIYETQTIEVKAHFSQLKEKIIENAREKVLIFLQENEIIKEENVTIKEGNGWHQVRYVITVQRNIGG